MAYVFLVILKTFQNHLTKRIVLNKKQNIGPAENVDGGNIIIIDQLNVKNVTIINSQKEKRKGLISDKLNVKIINKKYLKIGEPEYLYWL